MPLGTGFPTNPPDPGRSTGASPAIYRGGRRRICLPRHGGAGVLGLGLNDRRQHLRRLFQAISDVLSVVVLPGGVGRWGRWGLALGWLVKMWLVRGGGLPGWFRCRGNHGEGGVEFRWVEISDCRE